MTRRSKRPGEDRPGDRILPATGDRYSWDTDYTKRGRLWGGSSPALPVLLPGSRILELGCGNGKSLQNMTRQGWDVIGIDYSLPATALCRKNTGIENVAIIAGDARALPFRPGTFDAIFAYHILGHMLAADRRKSAAEITRVLGPSGSIYFRAFSGGDLRFGSGRELEDGTFLRGTGIFTHYFTRNEVAGLFFPLEPVSLDSHRWTMRVRGKDLVREEITAVLKYVPGMWYPELILHI